MMVMGVFIGVLTLLLRVSGVGKPGLYGVAMMSQQKADTGLIQLPDLRRWIEKVKFIGLLVGSGRRKSDTVMS